MDTIWTAASVACDEVLNPSTMDRPNLRTPVRTTRSGETAPLNAYSTGSLTEPRWNRRWCSGSISYHLMAEPAPPFTVCCVHTATRCLDESTAATAWSSRASRVSRRCCVPAWGAGGGME